MNIRYRGSITVRDVLHMTGGLRGERMRGGWVIGPLPGDGAPRAAGPVPDAGVGAVCRNLGVAVFGGDEISEIEPLLPTRIWTPLLPRLPHTAADTWAWVAAASHAAGDADYAALARNVSISLRAAGIRLRDASDEYHRQLVAALARGEAPGLRFSNFALTDLHLAFHSLLSEMGGARDYLASIAARRVGAPPGIDALNRLAGWVAKPAGRSAAGDPLVAAMLAAWDKSGLDPWLHDLGEYRNLFLHREPLGASERARWISLAERAGPLGRILLVQMQVEARPGTLQTCDALERFVDLHARLCRLADLAAGHAKHAPRPQVLGDSPA
jgi:hypothetical protein